MKKPIEKFRKVLADLESENGCALFFALFLREDSLNKWDLIISADWLDSKNVESYRIVANKIQQMLSSEELVELARLVILDKSDPIILFFRSSFDVLGDSFMDLSNCALSSNNINFPIKQAYIMRCISKR